VSAHRIRLTASASAALAVSLVLGACAAWEFEPVTEVEAQVVEITPETNQPTPEPELPETEIPDPVAAIIDEEIMDRDLRAKLAGLMMVTVDGMDPVVHREFVESLPVAGFLMLKTNLVGGAEPTRLFVEELQSNREFPLLIAVDQEGSPIARIAGDSFPGARVLGQDSVEATAEAFLARQKLVHSSGANLNFGVVADVSGGRGAYIHDRAFSTDTDVVTTHVFAAVRAQVPGVAQTLKHFPGHGLVFADTHKEVPLSTISLAEWQTTHQPPFVAGIAAGVEVVMMAHIRVATVSRDPASLSNDWIDILRRDLGFDGVVVSDDLSMLQSSGEPDYRDPAATRVGALVAGNDLLLLAVDPSEGSGYAVYDEVLDALVASVESGEVSLEQVERSLERVLALRHQLGNP
jgi:beta-N-acetylhexosaminidase